MPRKLKMTKKAVAARRAYRRRHHKGTKKGGARKGRPAGSRLAYDALPRRRHRRHRRRHRGCR